MNSNLVGLTESARGPNQADPPVRLCTLDRAVQLQEGLERSAACDGGLAQQPPQPALKVLPPSVKHLLQHARRREGAGACVYIQRVQGASQQELPDPGMDAILSTVGEVLRLGEASGLSVTCHALHTQNHDSQRVVARPLSASAAAIPLTLSFI